MRGSDTRKHGKHGKARENTSGKQCIWNTIEQYTGLKLRAASSFSDISFRNIRKGENRHFLTFEQYGRLESEQARIQAIQAARSRASRPALLVWIQGYQGSTQMTKSRKVAILATSLVPDISDPEGRLGPPDSRENTEKHGKAGKERFSGFLRVQGPSVEVAIMRGSEGSWSPQNGVAGLPPCSVFRAFSGPSRCGVTRAPGALVT